MESNITKAEKDSRAILVGVSERGDDDTDIMLDELERLADTAGVSVVARAVQPRQTPDPSTYIGSGKAKELADTCRINNVGLVIFDDELTPSQIKNLEDSFGGDVRVIDRSMLILDIFALHAATGEGKLQVELAQLQYTAPRLIGKGTELSRQQGGNIAMRGPGETKLETDRRHLHRRMSTLREQLAELERSRATMRGSRDRSGVKQISIAGYTNAGKSTLLNTLTGAGILAEDKLFATLDPTTRRYRLPCGEVILLTDTVGFIRNLPHHLIEAFKSTLDEVRYADIILVVIDASDPDFASQTAVTRELLGELGAASKPVLYVFNKCDRPAFEIPRISDIPSSDAVYISAKTGQGIDTLVEKLETLVLDGKKKIVLRIPNAEQAALGTAYQCATVTKVEYGDEYVDVEAIAGEKARALLSHWLV